jgi:hypothetical protein
MPNIYVDFDVFKAITARRPSEDVTENDVLRQLFGLPSGAKAAASDSRHRPGDWVTKGVRFPQGTQVRAKYKGQLYLAEVKDGALMLDGKRHHSPSSAAMAITRTPTNGWTFWEAKLPGTGDWRSMKAIRDDAQGAA